MAPTPALEFVKYDSESFIRNTGSIIVFFWLCIYIMFLLWFIKKVFIPKHKDEEKVGNKMLKSLFDGAMEKKMRRKIMKQHKSLENLTKEWNGMTIVNIL